jgi:hypothetical protein
MYGERKRCQYAIPRARVYGWVLIKGRLNPTCQLFDLLSPQAATQIGTIMLQPERWVNPDLMNIMAQNDVVTTIILLRRLGAVKRERRYYWTDSSTKSFDTDNLGANEKQPFRAILSIKLKSHRKLECMHSTTPRPLAFLGSARIYPRQERVSPMS